MIQTSLFFILLISSAIALPIDDVTTTENADVAETTEVQGGIFLLINLRNNHMFLLESKFDFIPLCKRNDPDLNECILNATVSLKDKFAEGIPELQLRSIDPLKIPNIKLEQTTNKLDYKAVLMDVALYGLSDYEFTDVE
jgi:hypothetical protein